MVASHAIHPGDQPPVLLPIAQEDAYIRRLPWVGFALVAANLIIHLAVTVEADDVGARIDRLAMEATEILLHHPNLEVDTDNPHLQRAFRWTQRTPGLPVAAEEAGDGLSDDEAIDEITRIFADIEAAFAEHPYFEWGTVPADLKPHTLLTAMFVHGGWLHLIFNFWLFWILAFSLEDRYGPVLFAVLYLGSGVVADVVHIAFHADSFTPVVGASGAIAGVMGAFMVRFPKARIRMWYWFVTMGTFVAPAWALLTFWIAEQLFYAIFLSAYLPVAYWAHVGGFFAGFGMAWVIKRYGWEQPEDDLVPAAPVLLPEHAMASAAPAPAASAPRASEPAFPTAAPASDPDLGLGLELTAAVLPVVAARLASTSAAGLALEDGRTVPLDAIEALSAALVGTPEGARVVLDVLVTAPHREVLRLDNRSLDPRRLMGRPDLDPMQAFQAFVQRMAQASSARLVPEDLFAAGPMPPRYPDVASYEAEQLARL